MSAYGYEIVQTLIVDIEPDEHVKRAMNEINAGNKILKYCPISDKCLVWLWLLQIFVLSYVYHFIV